MTQRTNNAPVPGISSTPVVIPKEPRFPGPVPGQTERVHLPLAAKSRLGFWGTLWICNAVLVGALCVIPVMVLPILPSKALPALLGMGTVVLFMIAFGIYSLAAAATALLDRIRGSRISIDTTGVWDSRFIRHPIHWTEVSRARIIYRSPYHRDGGVFGVQLTLRGPIKARHNPFRVGALGFFELWSRKANQLYLPLLLLSVSSHVLAHTILALVAMNGGDTED